MEKFYFNSIEFQALDSVYPPKEDSFLLAESIDEENADSKTVLDLGCGTGVQGMNAFIKGANNITFTDINPTAIKNAEINMKKLLEKEKQIEKNNNLQLEFIQSNLFENPKIPEKKFDLIIFNPPYLHSEKIKHVDLDGGTKGRAVLDCFLRNFPEHLNGKGNAYFLQTDINGVKETEKILEREGFNFEIKGKKKLFFEELLVFKAWKKSMKND